MSVGWSGESASWFCTEYVLCVFSAVCCPLCYHPHIPKNRLDMRLLTVNTTMVAPHQEAVQYLVYWQVMLSSSDPGTQAAAAWLQRGPGVTIWEVRAEKGTGRQREGGGSCRSMVAVRGRLGLAVGKAVDYCDSEGLQRTF